MAPWLAVLEQYMVAALLRTPAFHRGVEKVAHRVHRIRHNLPPEPKGGTSLDDPHSNANFLKHFSEEVQTQLGRAEARAAAAPAKHSRRSIPAEGENAEAAWKASEEEYVSRESVGKVGKEHARAEVEAEDADGVWRKAREGGAPAPKQGFLGEYMGALREQMRKGGG